MERMAKNPCLDENIVKWFKTSSEKRVQTKIVSLYSHDVYLRGWNRGKINGEGVYCIKTLYGSLYVNLRWVFWEEWYNMCSRLSPWEYVFIGNGQSCNSDSFLLKEEIDTLDSLFRKTLRSEPNLEALWEEWANWRWWKKIS
jgi:hypothetical protein